MKQAIGGVVRGSAGANPTSADRSPDRATAPLVRQWRSDVPLDLPRHLGPLLRGVGDPSNRRVITGPAHLHGWWHTCPTPLGPASVQLQMRDRHTVTAQAWGAGAPWVLEQLPRLLGSTDNPHGWATQHHHQVHAAHRRWPHLRLVRTDTLLDVVIPAVLEQRVTGEQAWQNWRRLLRWYGVPAPGPAPAGMRVVPPVAVWRAIASWRWHQAGVDPARAHTLARVLALPLWDHQGGVGACPVVHEQRWRTALAGVPGIGVWTLAEIAQRTWGDADALSVGDYHLAATIGWALAGRPFDDEQMLAQLACYAGHRHRVARLLAADGAAWRPRFGPRYRHQDLRAC